MKRKTLLELAREKVVVLDGAMGTTLQSHQLSPDDFEGLEGCSDVLVRSRPEVVADVHASFLAAGCDVVETNTFGANGVVLAEYGLAEQTLELNRLGAALARRVADDFATPSSPRYVLGSVGPGTQLPSLGHITFEELKRAFLPQLLGLVQGGADGVCIETCQDLLQCKAALVAAREAFAAEGRALPLFVSVTIESSGTMLVGSDVSTAVASLWPMDIDVLGLNCATGPLEMKRHVEHLSEVGPGLLMAMPNAGLPETVDGRVVYSLAPARFADWVEGFVRENGIGIVGGCCGTTPEYLAELVRRVGSLAAPVREPRRRAEASSLFQAVSLRQEPPPLLVGERTNANGSRAFRRRLLADDLEGMVAVAREQARGGAHLLDVSVAYAGRDEQADMSRLAARLSRTNRLPLVIDSTAPEVVEAALRLCGGRCVINSINLEEGWERLDTIARLARRYGAALIALAIDEKGMAMTRDRKLAVAERILERCRQVHNLGPQDLIFDMLTFTVGSGDAQSRNAAVETLEALGEFTRRHPECATILGVSNVSFGLKPAARRVLNSVFLHLALERGLDQAIVNARGILPLYRIDDGKVAAATRLLLNRDGESASLTDYLELFEGAPSRDSGGRTRPVAASPREALHQAVIDGAAGEVAGLLDKLLEGGLKPVDIINNVLIAAMKEVGELFGSGRMQLPFVLQSAEVMKGAVDLLRPHMEGQEALARGTLVLATVRGDVHDIGKNLVDIILSNNGFRVVNLGTKIEVDEILTAAREEGATAIGMSGLLVKSTLAMRENLQEMKRRGWTTPVLLGGAALTRDYVEGELTEVYSNPVYYCRDAFDGLRAMVDLEEQAAGVAPPRAAPSPDAAPPPGPSDAGEPLPAPVDHSLPVPRPPFWGTRVLGSIPLTEVFALLNERSLVRGQWRYRRGRLTEEEYLALTAEEVEPRLARLKTRCLEEKLLEARAVYGYFPCFRDGDALVVTDEQSHEVVRFPFPRQESSPGRCVADFFRPGPEAADIVGLFVVTVGSKVAAEAARLYREDRYREYLHLHGLAVESAEAAAEWMHARIRRELGIHAADASTDSGPCREYRGRRYSFGHPSCPDLASQESLFRLLQPARVSVTLTEAMQMVPEYSVSALVAHHPEACHFNLG